MFRCFVQDVWIGSKAGLDERSKDSSSRGITGSMTTRERFEALGIAGVVECCSWDTKDNIN